MINFNTVNKANTAQSLLPSFSETTDISGESFQSIFESVKESAYSNSVSPYSKKDNNYSSYQENNSYSSYSDTKSQSEKVSVNKFEKNDDNYNVSRDKRYGKDKENYEAVERKVYRDDSVSSRNVKDTNTIKEQNVFERKDVKTLHSNEEINSDKGIISNQKINSNQHIQLESNQQDTISIKDILALLQTAAKNNTGISVSNDEETALKESDMLLNNTNSNSEDVNIEAILQDIDKVLSELNLSGELKTQLENIVMSFENMPESDLQELVEYIGALSEDIKIADINEENISLEEISEKILGTEMDSNSLEKAYTALQEKISEITKQPQDSTAVEIENTANTTNAANTANTENSNNLSNALIDDKSANNEIINQLSQVIDEAVKDADLQSNDEKLELAKNIISTIKSAAESILTQPNTSGQQVMLDNVNLEEETVNVNFDILENETNQTTQLLDEGMEIQQPVLNQDKTAESSSKEPVKENTVSLNVETSDVLVEENMKNEKQNSENISKETAKETAKDMIKDIVKETVKDTAKQSDTVAVKDIQKEFKTANVEVTESLRGESNAKAELKANTVNLTETGKNLQNNLNQKEMVMGQNNAGENFSASQNDKGNNFNYFLKSSAEAQAKYDTAQGKEAQAPYNMKEPRDIERLVRTMQSSVNKGESKLTVVLTPENLGKMQIQLSESGGKITAKFLSDNENSHKLIMAQSDLLKNQLSEKGIVVDNMEFAYNDTMSKQQSNDEQGRRTSKHAQKGKGFKNQEDDLEVGTEVANKKASGIYA